MIDILYEDNHLLVVVKPVNIPVQLDSSIDEDLLTILKEDIKKRYDKPGNVYLGLVHRLDRPVGGVMVFARTSKAAARLARQIQNNEFHKSYMAVTQGRFDNRKDTLKDFLVKDSRTNTVTVTDEAHGKYAELSYEIRETKDDLALLDIDLKTGRSHQIRVQLSSRNCPIWGDQRYNPGAHPGQQIALWAYRLQFTHPTTGKTMTFSCQVPDSYPWNEFEVLKG